VANHPSALKRHRQSRKRRTANLAAKSKLRSQIRKVREAVADGNADAAAEQLKVASVALAKASSKGLLHPRNASRRTGRLARSVAKRSS